MSARNFSKARGNGLSVIRCGRGNLKDAFIETQSRSLVTLKGSGLFTKDLHHGLGLELIQIGEGLLYERAVFVRARMEEFVKAEGGVPEENLGVFEPFFVVGHGQMDFSR